MVKTPSPTGRLRLRRSAAEASTQPTPSIGARAVPVALLQAAGHGHLRSATAGANKYTPHIGAKQRAKYLRRMQARREG